MFPYTLRRQNGNGAHRTRKARREFEKKKKKLENIYGRQKIHDIFDNPDIRTAIEANKASYRWALNPKHQDIMTALSPRKIIIQRMTDYEHEKSLVKEALGILGKK
jgi:aromatic ring hydroxylase